MVGKAKFVTTVTVIDPDSKGEVNITIFKDLLSDGMFGIDESYLTEVLAPMADPDEPLIVESPFDSINLALMDANNEDVW